MPNPDFLQRPQRRRKKYKMLQETFLKISLVSFSKLSYKQQFLESLSRTKFFPPFLWILNIYALPNFYVIFDIILTFDFVAFGFWFPHKNDS